MSNELPMSNELLKHKTDEATFRAKWEEYLPGLDEAGALRWLAETSPHHPNSNMRWLYDRLLSHIAFGITRPGDAPKPGDVIAVPLDPIPFARWFPAAIAIVAALAFAIGVVLA